MPPEKALARDKPVIAKRAKPPINARTEIVKRKVAARRAMRRSPLSVIEAEGAVN